MGKPITDYEVVEIRFSKVGNAVNGMAWNKYGQVIAKATAKCHPEDKFDFSYGEALCNTRLIQEIARVKRAHRRHKYVKFQNKLYRVYEERATDREYFLPTRPSIRYCTENHKDTIRYYVEDYKDKFQKIYPRDYLMSGVYGVRENGMLFVVAGEFLINEDGGFDYVNEENLSLEENFLKDWDIVKIFSVNGGFDIARDVIKGEDICYEILWERE